MNYLFNGYKYLIKGTFYAYIIKAIGVSVTFFLNLLLSRRFGAYEMGFYFIALNIATIIFTIGAFGFPSSLLKYCSIFWSSKMYINVRKAIIIASKYIMFAGIIISIFVFVGAKYISVFSNKKELEIPLKIFSFVLIPSSLILILSEIFKAFNKISTSILIKDVLVPGLTIIYILLLNNTTVINQLYISRLFSSFIIALGAIIYMFYILKDKVVISAYEEFDKESFLLTTKSLFWVTFFQVIILWNDTFFLAFFSKPEDIGIYNIAKKIALLLSFFLYAISAVASRDFAIYYKQKKIKKLKQLYFRSILLLSIVVLPISLFIFFKAKLILSFFGNEFITGESILHWFVLGQLINVLFGPIGFVLIMIEGEKDYKNLLITVFLINILSNYFLIKTLDVTGAAVVFLITQVLLNTGTAYFVNKRIKLINI